MEYVTVNRAAYNWKPAEQEQARQDLITFIDYAHHLLTLTHRPVAHLNIEQIS